MEIFFAIIFVIGRLIYEAYQGYKADRYADSVVRRNSKK